MLGWNEFCVSVRIERAELQVWVEEGWILPRGPETGGPFADVDLARGRLIRDLNRELGVNHEGIGVVLELIDQVHGLRATLREVLTMVEREPPKTVERPDEP